MKKILLPAILVALVLTACHRDSFTISGTLDGANGHTLWLEEIAPDGPLFIDSIPVDAKGHFKYTYRMPYRSLYSLHATEDNFIVTLPDYGEHLKVNGTFDSLSQTYTIAGSPESALLWQLQQQTNDGALVLTDLVDTARHYEQLLNDGLIDKETAIAKRRTTDSIYRAERKIQQEYVCLFIEENSGSLATMIALYKTFNTTLLIRPSDTASLYYYNLVYDGLHERYPDNPHTLHFEKTVNRMNFELNPVE